MRGLIPGIAALGCLVAAPLAGQRPPVAERVEQTDIYHGVRVADPYRWLERLDSAPVRSWVRAQDTYARSFTARSPLRDSLVAALRLVAKAEVTSAPIERGGRYFYSRFPGTGPQRAVTVMMRRTLYERPLILAAGDSAAATASPTRFWPDPEGHRVAIAFSRESSIWEDLRVFDVDHDTFLPDSLGQVHGSLTTVTWSRDGRGFYYQRYDSAATLTSRVSAGRLAYHRLGTDQARDLTVAVTLGHNAFLSHTASVHGSYLILTVREAGQRQARVLVKDRDDPSADPVALVDSAVATFSYAGQLDRELLFHTDLDAPRGRVIAIDPSRPARRFWREVVAEGEAPIATWVGTVPAGVQVLNGLVLVTYVRDGVWSPTLFGPDGRKIADLPLPTPGPVWSGFVGSEDRAEAFGVVQGLADPGTVYRLDLASLRYTPLVWPDLPYDVSDIVTEHVLVPSEDGNLIPAFVVRRSTTSLDGSAPLVLYGYGFGGWNAAPYFYPAMALWVVRGGIWVVATPRGDGGFGTAWHLAGQRRNKPVGIADYLQVAAWLVEHRYTSPDRLVANGSSAGGPLVAGAVVRAPTRFAAMILDYPLVDVLRYQYFGYGRRWVVEYGTADDPADFAVLRAYSPYHNVHQGTCYPSTLLAPGERDGVAPPLHAYKLGAALQWAQSCTRPILVRTAWGAGHAAGASVERSVQNWADQLSFLDLVLPHEH